MSISVRKKGTPGMVYGNPFTSPSNQRDHIQLDITGFTLNEIDQYGYIKPGVPLTQAGTLPGGAPAFVYGVVPEAIKLPLAVLPATNASLAAETVRPLIGVRTDGVVNRDIVEDNLGRALSANEIAAFKAAGSHFSLTST